MLRDATRRSSDRPRPSHDAVRKSETLSARERLVVQRVAEGYSGVEIARLLSITPKTVTTYKARIAQKVGCTNRIDYLRVALQLGLVGGVSRQHGTIASGSHA